MTHISTSRVMSHLSLGGAGGITSHCPVSSLVTITELRIHDTSRSMSLLLPKAICKMYHRYTDLSNVQSNALYDSVSNNRCPSVWLVPEAPAICFINAMLYQRQLNSSVK